ncbi:MAG: response regulator, partial [bacterium]|nr:response regulator [bacterium]
MGKTIKVLIVDDSRMVRDILKDIFKEDKELEVIGEACNGIEAITLTRELMPDIVTMDIQMPEMDGFEATEHIMAYSPTPILILSSAIDKSEQYTGFKAISLGALDNMSKPDITQEGFNDIAGTLVKRVKMLSRIKVIPHIRGKLKSHHIHKKVQPLPENTEPSPGPDEQELLNQEAGNDARDVQELLRKTNATAVNVSKKRSKIKVIAIGASTGGPMALEKILSLFPADFPSGIVVVQHMAKGFIESFADWLGTKTPLKIKIGEDGEAIKSGTVYFAPDDVQLEINPDCTLRLNKHAPFWGEFKPSVNNL